MFKNVSLLSDTDTIYPEHLSRLHRRVVPKKRKGCSSRYRTQPVTFSEIKEVDEENVSETAASCRTTSTQELQNLNEKFEMFRRTSDIVFYSSKEEAGHNDSNIRNFSTNSKNLALTTSKSFDIIAQFQKPSFNDQV
ncbi:hypothetical protein HUJ04_010229 [Dendroctonus ponderosae]|nr:hypothetical protein HUJ04_010229 [Dendroctonus ponderosae]